MNSWLKPIERECELSKRYLAFIFHEPEYSPFCYRDYYQADTQYTCEAGDHSENGIYPNPDWDEIPF